MSAELEHRVGLLLAARDVRRAAEEVIEGYGPAIWRYVCTMSADEDDARDVFQMFAEDVWRGLESFRGDSAVRTWAYRVAWAAMSRFRRDAYRQRRRPLPTDELSKLAASVTARSIQRRSAEDTALDALRSSLPEEDRVLLVLRLDRELSWDEVAGILSAAGTAVSAAALRKRFERLKERLKEQARSAGITR